MGLMACQKTELVTDDAKKPNTETDGHSDTDTTPLTVITVADLANTPTGESVAVSGYIVGSITGGNSLKSMTFGTEPATASNLVIADYPDEDDPSCCAAIQLPANSSLRDELNLLDNPDNCGKRVIVMGTRATYFSFPGIKPVTDFYWADDDADDDDWPTAPDSLQTEWGNITLSHAAATVLIGD